MLSTATSTISGNTTTPVHQSTGKMKSTWYLRKEAKLTPVMRFVNSVFDHRNPPVAEKHYGKLPVSSSFDMMLRFAPPVLAAVGVQYLVHTYWRALPLWAASLYWFFVQHFVTDWATNKFVQLGYKWGYLDGDKPRDKVPDFKLNRIAITFVTSVVFRVGLAALYLYDPEQPVALDLLFPVKLFAFCLSLDFFFYTYHRASHEIGTIPLLGFDAWNIHKTHHLTKHPIPSLTILADDLQELIEIVGCPALATLVCQTIFPNFTFYDFITAMTFISITEVLGHTGIRAKIDIFTTGFVFNWLLPQAVLTVEDHDLHHREGWRKASNYGKQSLFWDLLFGTKRDRPESYDANVDFSLSVWGPVPEGHTTPPTDRVK